MLPVGTKVASTRDLTIKGEIVGYGMLQWPQPDGLGPNGDFNPVAVYLVKVRVGSSSLGQACVVMESKHVVDMASKP